MDRTETSGKNFDGNVFFADLLVIPGIFRLPSSKPRHPAGTLILNFSISRSMTLLE